MYNSLQIEPHDSCSYEHIMLKNVESINSEQKFCQSSDILDQVFISEGNSMTVQFSTDSSVTYDGFKADFKQGKCYAY